MATLAAYPLSVQPGREMVDVLIMLPSMSLARSRRTAADQRQGCRHGATEWSAGLADRHSASCLARNRPRKRAHLEGRLP
jgi:hypothetical protein